MQLNILWISDESVEHFSSHLKVNQVFYYYVKIGGITMGLNHDSEKGIIIWDLPLSTTPFSFTHSIKMLQWI